MARVVEVAGGEGQHAQAPFRQLLVRREDLVVDLGDRHLLAFHSALAHRSMTTSGAPFTVTKCGCLRSPPASQSGPVVEGRHELVLGVERHLRPAGERPPGLLGVDADLGREDDERGLGRVADDRLVVGDRGVGAQARARARGDGKSGVAPPPAPRIAPVFA